MDQPHRSPLTLERATEELETAVAELHRAREAHRRVESLLLTVLEHLPVGVVVVDPQLRVRAASAYAQERWSVVLDRRLDDAQVPSPIRTAIDATIRTGQRTSIIGAGAGELVDPGGGARYVVGWGSFIDE